MFWLHFLMIQSCFLHVQVLNISWTLMWVSLKHSFDIYLSTFADLKLQIFYYHKVLEKKLQFSNLSWFLHDVEHKNDIEPQCIFIVCKGYFRTVAFAGSATWQKWQ